MRVGDHNRRSLWLRFAQSTALWAKNEGRLAGPHATAGGFLPELARNESIRVFCVFRNRRLAVSPRSQWDS